jgi:hypothetical protein
LQRIAAAGAVDAAALRQVLRTNNPLGSTAEFPLDRRRQRC